MEVRHLLGEVLELPKDQRQVYLRENCPEPDLRAEIEGYLADEDAVEDFIEVPASRLLEPRSPELREGQRVGVYQLEHRLGQGGMGVVYLARRVDNVYQQQVAVKILKRGLDTEEISARFHRERQILAHLSHAHIARILDGGSTEDGLPYFVMEYVDGTPLHHYCSQKDLGVEARLELFRQICDTVHFAHQNLVVHCDLKPANILVTPEGVPMLLDFGVAKLLRGPASDVTVTRFPWRPGTPPYMSPEQARGEAITTASDVYSLGVLLHELLTGQPLGQLPTPSTPSRPPWDTATPRPSARVLAAGNGAGERQRQQRARRLRGDLDNIVLKAMHPETARRYASAAALSEDLRRHLVHLPVSARPDSLLYRFGRFVRRYPAQVAVSAAAAVMVLGLVVLLASQLQRTQAQRDRATVLRDSFLEMLETLDLTNRGTSSHVAVDAIEEALRQELSPNLQDRVRLLDRMGMVYSRFGLLEEAERLLREALRLQRSAPHPDAARLAVTLNNLGLVLLDMGRTDEATELFEESLDVNPAQDHEQRGAAVKTRSNLAAVLTRRGDLAAAEQAYGKLLEDKRDLHGNQSPEVASGLHSLGGVLIRRNKLDEAEPLLRRALEMRQAILGPESLQVAKTLMLLGTLLDARGRVDEAAATYRQALDVRLLHVPEDHPDVARVHAALGFSLLGIGGEAELAEAETLIRRAVDVLVQRPGPDHSTTLIVRRNLAATLLARGQASAAEALLREVVGYWTAGRTPDHWRAADARSVLGHCLIGQGRYAEAEDLVVRSYPVIRDVKGDGSRYAEEARQRIVALYEGWGRDDEAAPYRTASPLRQESPR